MPNWERIHRFSFPLGLAGLLFSASVSSQESAMNLQSLIEGKQGSEWQGPAELWIDPLGNETLHSDATLRVEGDGLSYTWAYDGKAQRGSLRLTDAGLSWRDSWHQPEPVELTPIDDALGIVTAGYSYPAGTGPDWHWRIKLTQRPDSTLVLAMTNIAPWGEEARAVRMIFSADQ
jgi:hypothetical protein